MTTSKQVYHKQYRCPQCGDLLAYERNPIKEEALQDLLFCESCENYENLVSAAGKIFVEVLSDRRRVKGNVGAKFVLKDYQLKTPVSYDGGKWLVYNLGEEKVFYIQKDKSYEIEGSGKVTEFTNCTEMLSYFQPRLVNYEHNS